MERQFTEQEVSAIIQQAADLQARFAPKATPSRQGLTESELIHVAKELGLSEQFVRDAIKSPLSIVAADTGDVATMSRTLERVLPGFPGTKAFELVLDEIGPSAGMHSGPNVVGDTMTYNAMIGQTQCEMKVSRSDARTRVKVDAKTFVPSLAIGMPLGFFLFAFVISLAKLATVAGLAGGVVALIGGLVGGLGIWALIRWINKWSNRKVENRLESLVKRFEQEYMDSQSLEAQSDREESL